MDGDQTEGEEAVLPAARAHLGGDVLGETFLGVALHREAGPLEIDVGRRRALELGDQAGVGILIVVKDDLLHLDVRIGLLEIGDDAVERILLGAAGDRMGDADLDRLRPSPLAKGQSRRTESRSGDQPDRRDSAILSVSP